jgi:hypothetical protein
MWKVGSKPERRTVQNCVRIRVVRRREEGAADVCQIMKTERHDRKEENKFLVLYRNMTQERGRGLHTDII